MRMIQNIREYQDCAARTINPDLTHRMQLDHAVLGLNSEAGEIAGLFQKRFQGHDLDTEHLIKELGDCLWMIAEACTAMGVGMDVVATVNIEKLMERYPDGFTTEHSLHRKEGDV